MDNNLLKSNISDILKSDGILSRGYGIIPKEIMLDTSLSIEAKAIFSFISCHTGGGESAFPKRDTILKALNISKDRYYKHLDFLLNSGYITCEQKRNPGGTFSHNEYTVHYNLDKGFGFIPRLIMYDARFSIGEKGLYALYMSFAGSGKESVVSLKKKDILYFLDISHDKFTRLNKALIENNLITSARTHVNGRFAESAVSIVYNPDDISHLDDIRKTLICYTQDPQNKDTVKIQEPENKDTVRKQEPIFKDTEKQDPQNKDTAKYINNNNSNINNCVNNNKRGDAPLAFHHFSSLAGELDIKHEDHEKLDILFENIDGLYERTVCALAQRNKPPKSLYHFIIELGRKEKWPEKSEEATLKRQQILKNQEKLERELKQQADLEEEKYLEKIMNEHNLISVEAAKQYLKEKSKQKMLQLGIKIE